MAHRTKLTVAYLGGSFHGWQRQRDRHTVQGELERAVAAMTGGLEATVVGAGRTDAGVHAAGQVAHLDLPVRIPPEALVRALNGLLPETIRVRAATAVDGAFHARRSARAKLYSYRARWRPAALPWLGLRCAVVPPVSDPGALERAAALLVGPHDFATFTVPEAAVGPTARTLHRVWTARRRDGLDLHFVGDGFLRYQVRRMVGALLEVGRGQLEHADFERLLAQPMPGAPIRTAPARGLTLERVFYGATPLPGGARLAADLPCDRDR
ncbi:MAG TPA: tRNA pseudouridine(38-40) synthase TruA [Thermoanaerobaculales bacterium]|nr:tRNA pseudouridine(38-40) synthase TruA [Thermoanaerobaculales bacterium]